MTELRPDLGPLFPDQNPFSTWAVRPGAIRFRFAAGHSVESLLADLQRHQWWGEILGPHGSGKSTLLYALAAALAECGREVKRLRVQATDRRVPIAGADLKTWNEQTQVIVEGFEQISGWNRKLLEKTIRGQGAGLLVTAHSSVGLPTIYQTSVTAELVQSIVHDLLPADCDFISSADAAASFARHNQNLREILFDMYDLYEKRRPRDSSPS